MIPMATTGDLLEPFSLYIHIPFCSKKCPYCHFYVTKEEEAEKDLLLRALLEEWQTVLPLLSHKKIVSIYFGGGTPLLFSPVRIHALLSKIFSSGLAVDPAVEITLEANPEGVTPFLMEQFRAAGINRVSLGVQSLDDECLKILGREHNAKRAELAVLDTFDAGIKNISIDLMYDIPHQKVDRWRGELKNLKNLPLSHLSLYYLTFEPETPFFRKQAILKAFVPQEEESLQLLETAVALFEEIGLFRYEVSAFAKEGFSSKHNLGYWTARPFLGLGPSAFSYWEGKRFRNIPHLKKYASLLAEGKSPVDFEERLLGPSHLAELLAVELRLLEGVNLKSFQKKHGTLPSFFFEHFQSLEKKGWLKTVGDKIALSAQGLLFYDSVAAEII